MQTHAGPLLEAHWQEVGRNREVMRLSPMWDAYRAMEESGRLLALAAFDEAGQMVGYSASFVIRNLHYSEVIYAQNDVLFVADSARKGGIAASLMEETERRAAEMGAVEVRWHAKEGSKLDRILRRKKGYSVQDITFSKMLGGV
jgi:predicted GNAT superfamily acetyltransferase